MGEIIGGVIPGLAELGGAGIARNAISELVETKGAHGWLELGLGVASLVPGAMSVSAASKEVVAALRGGETLVSEAAITERIASKEIGVGAREIVQATNELPKDGLFARVVTQERAAQFLNNDANFGSRLSPELKDTVTFKKGETFVTAYDDISDLKTPNDFANRLTLMSDKNGTVFRDNANTVIVFKKSDAIAAATPIKPELRGYGNTGMGLTKNGAREWIIENDTLAGMQSKGLEIQGVFSVDKSGRRFEWNTVVKDGKTFWGTFNGSDEDNRIESVQQKQLYQLLHTRPENRIAQRNTEGDFEVLYKCPWCGQLWVYYEESTGHGEREIYRKISVEDAKADSIPTPNSNSSLVKNAAVVGIVGALGAAVVGTLVAPTQAATTATETAFPKTSSVLIPTGIPGILIQAHTLTNLEAPIVNAANHFVGKIQNLITNLPVVLATKEKIEIYEDNTATSIGSLMIASGVTTKVRIGMGLVTNTVSGDALDKQPPLTFDPKHPMVFINGVLTTNDYAKDEAIQIARKENISNIAIVRNNTHFVVGDFLQIIGQELGAQDITAIRARDAMRYSIQKYGVVYVEAHSQGAEIASASFTSSYAGGTIEGCIRR